VAVMFTTCADEGVAEMSNVAATAAPHNSRFMSMSPCRGVPRDGERIAGTGPWKIPARSTGYVRDGSRTLTAVETRFRNAAAFALRASAPKADFALRAQAPQALSRRQPGKQHYSHGDPACLPRKVGALVNEEQAKAQHDRTGHEEPSIELLEALNLL